jgi:hypothetical protein
MIALLSALSMLAHGFGHDTGEIATELEAVLGEGAAV